MPYCPYCGSEVLSGSNFCPSCGKNLNEPNKSEEATSSFENETSSSANRFSNSYSTNKDSSSGKSDVKMAAFILCVITCVVYAVTIVGLFGLIWCLPITLKINKSIRENEPLSPGFKVCVLLFVNTIAGILLLVDKE